MKNINTFILLICFGFISSNVHSQCYTSTTASIIPSSITDANTDGIPDDGTSIDVCYTINGWDDGGSAEDWLHGVQVDLPASGFDNASVVSLSVPPSEQADFYDTGVVYAGVCTYTWGYESPDMASTGQAGTTDYDFGWYVDDACDNDSAMGHDVSQCGENTAFTPFAFGGNGNGHDNFGLPSTSQNTGPVCPVIVGTYNVLGTPATTWTYCFRVTLDCGGDCGTTPPGDIVFYAQGDGTTGNWNSTACTDPGTPVVFSDLLGCAPTCAQIDDASFGACNSEVRTDFDAYAANPFEPASACNDITIPDGTTGTNCIEFVANQEVMGIGTGITSSGPDAPDCTTSTFALYDASCTDITSTNYLAQPSNIPGDGVNNSFVGSVYDLVPGTTYRLCYTITAVNCDVSRACYMPYGEDCGQVYDGDEDLVYDASCGISISGAFSVTGDLPSGPNYASASYSLVGSFDPAFDPHGSTDTDPSTTTPTVYDGTAATLPSNSDCDIKIYYLKYTIIGITHPDTGNPITLNQIGCDLAGPSFPFPILPDGPLSNFLDITNGDCGTATDVQATIGGSCDGIVTISPPAGGATTPTAGQSGTDDWTVSFDIPAELTADGFPASCADVTISVPYNCSVGCNADNGTWNNP